jgi:hypothetical protein
MRFGSCIDRLIPRTLDLRWGQERLLRDALRCVVLPPAAFADVRANASDLASPVATITGIVLAA